MLLACGAIAGPLFVIALLVEGATRADYNPLRHPVSSLQLGNLGWTQVVNFVVTGLLTLAFAVGIRRALRPLGGSTWAPFLVAACGVGLIGAGLFPADPLSGYPPGPPDQRVYSILGAFHVGFSALFFLGLPAACFVFARRFAEWGSRDWGIYSALSGLLFIVAFVLTSIAFNQAEALVEYGGLFQRITLVIGFGWLSLLGVHLLRTSESVATTPTIALW
jgi:hypothetical protein